MLMAILIPIILFFVLVAWAVSGYNRLVTLRNRFKNAFAQIEVQLKRRYDLIPNLVETVKGYMKFEQETLQQVIAARNTATAAVQRAAADPADAAAVQSLASAEAALGAGLGRLFALAEAYPDLKANQNMAQLQEELASTENKVAFARQAYNDAVTAYNTAREVFPSSLIANNFGFKEAALLQIDNPAEREAPRISFT